MFRQIIYRYLNLLHVGNRKVKPSRIHAPVGTTSILYSYNNGVLYGTYRSEKPHKSIRDDMKSDLFADVEITEDCLSKRIFKIRMEHRTN